MLSCSLQACSPGLTGRVENRPSKEAICDQKDIIKTEFEGRKESGPQPGSQTASVMMSSQPRD